MEKAINFDRLIWSCSTSENRKKAWKKYLNSKKIEKISYSTFCKKIKKFGIDTSNFVKKGRKWTEYDYVIHNHSIGKKPNHTTVRKIKNFLGNICYNCGEKTGLELHHIDWNHNNTKKSNLVVLCGTCHNNVHSLGRKVA